MTKNYFMVRPMAQSEEYLNNFTKNSIVAVGWSDVNFTEHLNNLESIFSKLDYLKDVAPQIQGRHKNQIRRFCSIKEGDRILIPYWDSVLLATATGEPKYNENVDINQANEHRVNYLLQKSSPELLLIPRTYLSEGLQRRIRVRGMTISDLNEFSDEIEKFFKTAEKEGIAFSWNKELEKKKQEQLEKLKEQLLTNLQEGKTIIKTGGIGLEELVLELTALEGYTSHILSKQAFKSHADADIEGVKADKFGENKILIQVKHHQGTSGDWGIEQLVEIKNSSKDIYKDHALIFVTSANIYPEAIKKAEKNDIIVISGLELIDWIMDSLPRLSNETKIKLGIVELPQLLLFENNS